MKRNRLAFTLVEVAISASLFAVIGLVIVGTLTNGIKVWERIYAEDKSQDINIFFEKLTKDLRNTFKYKNIPFAGTKKNIDFATLVTTNSLNPGLKKGVGMVSYRFREDQKAIYKTTRNLSAIYKDKINLAEKVLTDVETFQLSYYFYDLENELFLWTAVWDRESLPIAVSIDISISYENKILKFSKNISIPIKN